MDDGDLIRGVLAGRTQDFEVLVERHQKPLHAFVLRYLGDAAGADEIVQAAFVQAYVHLAGFRGEATFRSWLHEIALNLCRGRLRSGRARLEVALDDVPEGELGDPRGDPAEAPPRADLEREIARLPPRQRSVLTLRVFADLSFREIARLEGITENAAKVNYHHAVKRLKRWLS